MVTAADLQQASSGEMSKGKVVAACLVIMAIGAAIGYFGATTRSDPGLARLPRCCALVGSTELGLRDEHNQCVPRNGRSCEYAD